MKRDGLPHLIDLGGVETLGGKKFRGTICSVDIEANGIARVTAQTDVVQQCRGKEQGLIDLLGQVQVVAEHTGEDPASSTVISHRAALSLNTNSIASEAHGASGVSSKAAESFDIRNTNPQ